MNLPAHFFSFYICIISIILSVLVCVDAGIKIKWKTLDKRALNAWCVLCILLMLLWCLRGGFLSGLAYHLLGGVLLTLLSGVYFARLGMALILLGVTITGGLEWQAFGINYLLMGVTPTLIASIFLYFARYYLPSNYFIYLFFNAFLAGGVSLACTACLGLFTLFFVGAYSADYLFGDALAFYLLLSWSEAFMTGFIIAVLVVYRPHWVLTFEDRYYLKKPNQS